MRLFMIVGAFISHGDACWLPHKLRAMSLICDRVFVLLDRAEECVEICKRFSNVDYMCVDSRAGDIGMQHDGPTWSEGRLRQRVWDWATACKPQWVILGDTDEVPAPSCVEWLRHSRPNVDVWYSRWINLCPDAGFAIGGKESVWSFQSDKGNRKGVAVRFDPAKQYRYRVDATRHVRMEPSPLSETAAVFDEAHRLAPFPLIHYRWAAWDRWRQSPMSALPAYQPWPPADAESTAVPRHWLWRWDADEYIKRLPDQVAVVGNGEIYGRGSEIDSHAAVIRMNNFATDGYEAHVGKRTTCWYTNCWDDVRLRDWTGDMLTGYTDHEQRDRLDRWLGHYPHMHAPLGDSWFDDARRVKGEHPSHGFTLLRRLVHHGKRVHAYGFDGFRTGHYWDATHKHTHPPESAALAKLQGVTLR